MNYYGRSTRDIMEGAESSSFALCNLGLKELTIYGLGLYNLLYERALLKE
jgi:hypothetical protein